MSCMNTLGTIRRYSGINDMLKWTLNVAVIVGQSPNPIYTELFTHSTNQHIIDTRRDSW